MHDRIPFFLALRSSVRRFQMPFEGLSLVKTLVKFGTIYATDPLLQNKTKIVCLRWLTFDIFNHKPLQTMLNYVRQFIKIRVVFFCISGTSNSLSDSSKNCKKIYRVENFPANVLKYHVFIVCQHWHANWPHSIYQYSNIDPRLSGQNCKFLKFLFSFNSQKTLLYKQNTTKYRSLPESLGAMLEYWYIERGPL